MSPPTRLSENIESIRKALPYDENLASKLLIPTQFASSIVDLQSEKEILRRVIKCNKALQGLRFSILTLRMVRYEPIDTLSSDTGAPSSDRGNP